MSRVAVLGPTTLLGREVRDLLDKHRDRWTEVILLATSEEEVGTVTESGGAAALVSEASPVSLEGVDLVISCGALEEDLPRVEARAPGAGAILVSPAATSGHGTPVVTGINPEDAIGGVVIVSPHPAAIALSYLLAPLTELGLAGASATVIQPVSMFGDQGLADLLSQTRDILAMVGDRRETIFDRQLAFNLYPAPEGSAALADLVRGVTGLEAPIAVDTVQAAIFHGLSINLFVRFDEDPGEDRLRESLAAQTHVTVREPEAAGGEEPDQEPGPIDVAAHEDVLVGSLRADPGAPGGYWIWAVMDNLTRGGALNAVEIAERVG